MARRPSGVTTGHMKALAKLLRDARRASGLTQAQAAIRAHMGQQTLSLYESGKTSIVNFFVLDVLAEIYGLPLSHFSLMGKPAGPELIATIEARDATIRELEEELQILRSHG